MEIMDMKKIKWIIAREGLIVLGLAVVLYLLVIFFQNVPVALPQYRLEFANGSAYTISINPKLRNDYNYKNLLKETYLPSQQLIKERVKEFISLARIKSPLKSARCVNAIQIKVSKLYSQFFGVLFIFRVFIIYFILLLLRFIFWSVRILKNREQHG